MLPVFNDDKKRKINLGGVFNVATPATIINRVHEERSIRAQQKRRVEKAVRLQAWWRGIREARDAKIEMRKAFQTDVTGITGLRCLVLIGRDDEVLSQWSKAMLELGEAGIFTPALGDQRMSWLVLIRQSCLLLLQSVADSPQSENALTYLQVLNILLSQDLAVSVMGSDGISLCTTITEYLFNHRLYELLRAAIQRIPGESKTSPSLPPLMHLVTLPLSTVSPTLPQYGHYLATIFSVILTIPRLLNRLPLDHLPKFISRLSLSTLNVLDPHITSITQSSNVESRIHLASTVYMFLSPQYKALPPAALSTYLQLSISLFNEFPTNFVPGSSKSHSSTKTTKPKTTGNKDSYDDDDNDGSSTSIRVVDNFSTPPPSPPPPPEIDDKTIKRFQNLIAAPHLTSIISSTRSNPVVFPHLIQYIFTLTTTWPSSRDQILNIRELYHELVRQSPLGKEESSERLLVLFLCDLYSQALLTMGDDEFFGSSPGTGGARNPLSPDELVAFGRQLLNIAFTLFWRDDQSLLQETNVSSQIRCTWEDVRDKVTKCLLGIHARDSRKPFVPPAHWLVMSELDMQSFIEAAILEEQQISKPDSQFSRTLSKRQIAVMSPRLGILNNIPFAIPFEVRVSIFRHFVMNDMMSRGITRYNRLGMINKARIQVRWGMVAQDGFDKLAEVNLKAPIEISFIDQFGQEEAGIDGGGVFKEFFTSLCQEVFDTDRGLWLANKKNELYPNPHAYATEAHSLNWYRFIGRILGKAMYEGILVDVAFAGFFLAKWLGKQSFLDDLSSLDPDLYNGLIFLKHYAGDPEDLSLNFTMAMEEFGVTKSVDLIPKGSDVAVTRENRLVYIYLVSHYRLSKQIKLQSEAFFEGLSEMVDPKWLRMFNQQEVQILIGGVNSPIDLDDLQRNTNYGGLYDEKHETIIAFWKVVNSFDQEQRRALLRFVTSCSRPPLLGFKELVPNFSIRDAGSDQYRLPTSSTCVNLLKLPRYTSDQALRTKLLQAINSGAGFDLS
ncbi:HECT-domain-containing protein [Phlegmacium glaucopus]|nr:HECT-domain-containing protein [Phlegmacium glaucopus]